MRRVSTWGSWLAGVVAAGLSLPAQALTFNVNSAASFLEHVSGANTPKIYRNAELLYKADFGKGGVVTESGVADLFGASVDRDGLLAQLKLNQGAGRPAALYLALKSSNEYVVWDISGWDPTRHDMLQVLNDRILNAPRGRHLPQAQEISHIAIYGSQRAAVNGAQNAIVTSVPDGGQALLLLGMGAAGLFVLSRAARSQARR